MKVLNEFLIGADPEFVAFDKEGRLIDCSVLADGSPTIGQDHGGDAGELRPKPKESVAGLLTEIKKLIFDQKIEKLGADKLQAGPIARWTERKGQARVGALRPAGGFITLGGHVHFGVRPYRLSYDPDDHFVPGGKDREQGKVAFTDDVAEYREHPEKFTQTHGNRLRALDRFTHTLEYLEILPSSRERRSLSQYGRWGAFCAHKDRTEYRTMCSWLFSPKAADICLTGSKFCVRSPLTSLRLLGDKSRGITQLRELFAHFAPRDDDANRVDDLLHASLANVIEPWNVDFRPRWEKVSWG